MKSFLIKCCVLTSVVLTTGCTLLSTTCGTKCESECVREELVEEVKLISENYWEWRESVDHLGGERVSINTPSNLDLPDPWDRN
jgi:hypothetical protein